MYKYFSKSFLYWYWYIEVYDLIGSFAISCLNIKLFVRTTDLYTIHF